MPFGPEPETGRETKWRFRLEREDGTPADPPTPRRPSPRGAGDAIPLGRERTLGVVDVRPAPGVVR